MPHSCQPLAHVQGSRLIQYWADDQPAPNAINVTGTVMQSDAGCSERWHRLGIKKYVSASDHCEQVFFPQALPKRFDVIISGNPAGRSGMVLERLRGLKVGLFGPWEGGWDRFPDWSDSYCGGISDSETLNRFYNQARICLDMSFDQNLDSTNFIVFNAMASGCLLVTNDKPALHDLFQPGIVPAYTADFRPVIDRYL